MLFVCDAVKVRCLVAVHTEELCTVRNMMLIFNYDFVNVTNKKFCFAVVFNAVLFSISP